MSVQQEKFKEIADAIREKTNSTDKIKPSEFAGKVDEVYEAGKKSVVIKGTKSGEVVTITDVSPYEHEMSVKVKPKNLIPYPYYNTTKTEDGITYTDNGDGSITVNGTASAFSTFYLTSSLSTASIDDLLEDGKTYRYSCGSISGVVPVLQYKELSSNAAQYVYNNGTFTVDKSKYRYGNIRIQVGANGAPDNVIVYPLLAEDVDMTTVNVNVYTENEKVGTYPANTDGTVEGVISHSPTTILSADKSGVIIDCTYNRDIDKVVEISVEEGKQAEHERFWHDFLINMGSGAFAFAGAGWNDESFNPPRGTVIQPRYAWYMFASSAITDLAGLCERGGFTIDFSKSTSLQYTFYNGNGSKLTRVGVIDTRGANAINYTFYGLVYLHTIDKIILKEDGSQSFVGPFYGCSALENVEIEGVIGKNGFDVSPCTKLTHDSLMSILNAGRNCILNLGTANLEKLSVEEKAIAIEKGCTLI